MRHQDIQTGMTLRLKRDNGYGFGPVTVEVLALVPRPGYSVPHIFGRYAPDAEPGYFRPSDFERAYSA
jgi:hypothetical protein